MLGDTATGGSWYEACAVSREEGPKREPVVLPEGTVDLRTEIVPAVRALLERGLEDDYLKASVRIGAFTPFGGGLKADLVGGLRIDVNAALKLGDSELDLHRQLMEAVDRVRARTFPEVLSLVRLKDGRRLMFMEQLLGHETLLDMTYLRPTTRGDLERVLDKVIEGVRAIRRTARAEPRMVRRLPVTADPYTARLRDRLGKILDADPDLSVMDERGGTVLGVEVPPLPQLLDEVGAWVPGALEGAPRVPCHGDLHLGNVMVRRRGRGWSVRLIDPNPGIGVTDPLYDAGKLLHWAEPVGWARVAPEGCRTRLRGGSDGWRLEAWMEGASDAADKRRGWLEQSIHDRLARLGRASDTTRAARLHIAVASAHVGLAALLVRPSDQHARRFALAHALAALGRWRTQM